MHDHAHVQDRHAATPTPERLDAHPTLTGRGVVLAFVDVGFFPHPDLVHPTNRILAYHDVTDPRADLWHDASPEAARRRGLGATVVAAGNGFLSNGVFRSLAPRAEIVLVKVREEQETAAESLVEGLNWLLEQHERYGIRIVTISVSGESGGSPAGRDIDPLVERLVESGVVVVAAAGNSGCAQQHRSFPPATAASAITVGGAGDHNDLGHRRAGRYCSSFGVGERGEMKPEVIGPSARIAAPILPGTRQYAVAEALSTLVATPDYRLRHAAHELRHDAELPPAALDGPLDSLRHYLREQVARRRIVATHYQRVDGASLVAPFVASVTAQMLEANPALDPATVKRILIQTADRIQRPSVARQGFGRVNPRNAVEYARRLTHLPPAESLIPPHIVGDRLVFSFRDGRAAAVGVAGDFSDWKAQDMTQTEEGEWRYERPAPPAGRYLYKLVLDGNQWVPDPSNDLVEEDGHGGFNSVLSVREMYDPAP